MFELDFGQNIDKQQENALFTAACLIVVPIVAVLLGLVVGTMWTNALGTNHSFHLFYWLASHRGKNGNHHHGLAAFAWRYFFVIFNLYLAYQVLEVCAAFYRSLRTLMVGKEVEVISPPAHYNQTGGWE